MKTFINRHLKSTKTSVHENVLFYETTKFRAHANKQFYSMQYVKRRFQLSMASGDWNSFVCQSKKYDALTIIVEEITTHSLSLKNRSLHVSLIKKVIH